MELLDELASQIAHKTGSDAGLNKRLVLFGGSDTSAAARQISDFVEAHLGARIVEVLLVAVANAGTFGLRLSDGRSVFLKIHVGMSPDLLNAMHEAQEKFRERGIPAARLILPVREFREGSFASVHAFRDRGGKLRAGNRGSVEAAAAGLARLNEVSREIAPTGIRSIFESLSNTINDRAEGAPAPPVRPEALRTWTMFSDVRARAMDLPGQPLVSHGDWSGRNLRFWHGDVSSIFDFEALVRGPESFLVGFSAVLFVNEPTGVTNPADAAARFVEAYEQKSGEKLEGEDAISLDAGVSYAVARYLFATVRSGHVKDEESEDIFRIFMGKFRARFARDYKPLV